MTGIERLREFTEARPSLLTCDQIEELRDIAGQIRREITPQERHDRLADGHADVSMSAYDLLPEEDRRAIALVRASGGLDAVCEAVDFFEGMHDGLYTIDATERHTGDEMIREVFGWHSRRMPEGMEWPHYDTEELVDLGCEVARDDGMPAFVDKVVFTGDRWQLFDRYGCEINGEPMGPGERLTRPVRAISAEGEEIRADSDVWWICEGDERGVHAERLHVESIGPTGLAECSPHNGGTWVHLEPSELYVNEPVLAADGKQLREGETVWDIRTGREYVVIDPSYGNTAVVRLAKYDDAESEQYAPDHLTHERPDSWECLEEDTRKAPCEYFCQSYGCGGCPHYPSSCQYDKAIDLVRRAKRLAGGA